jgi:serine/threonine protein kinase
MLYEIIETDSELYIVMEYCEGGELFDHIVGCQRLSETESCRLFLQLLDGIDYIH